jgi:hypothetical protein
LHTLSKAKKPSKEKADKPETFEYKIQEIIRRRKNEKN